MKIKLNKMSALEQIGSVEQVNIEQVELCKYMMEIMEKKQLLL